jgi:bacillithiol biosynthesis cysteine-adding enzyme BshC
MTLTSPPQIVKTQQAATVHPGAKTWIDYRELPPSGGFSQLFFDYLFEYDEVKDFFPSHFRDPEACTRIIDSITQRGPDRERLVRILSRQNTQFGMGSATVANIRLLEKPTGFAVVTGQQVGLFGGPMYTIYKTVTALKLTKTLKERHPKYDFVPVFWLEGEDHDFEEMSGVTVLDREGKPVNLRYTHSDVDKEKNLGPIGELVLDASIGSVFSQLEACLGSSEFTDRLTAKLKECYAPGTTFLHAFVSWMKNLFEDSGLIFVSSNDKEVKSVLGPLFEREINEHPLTSQLVITRSAALEERYHAQVKPKSINLFMFHRGGRYLIEPRETDFSLKGTRHFISREDMASLLRNSPELFSPNVVIRPVAQDALLPTVACVAGPSEIAYYAQLSPVYERFGITQPLLYPRMSGSFIEDRLERVLEKFQLDLSQCFENPEGVTTRVLRQIEGINVDALFAKADEGVRAVTGELKFGLTEIDQTLLPPLDGIRSKMEGALQVLKEKTLAAQKRRNETALRQIERGLATLLPNGNLQERELNIIYYMNKYGPELVTWLQSELDPGVIKHQAITL